MAIQTANSDLRARILSAHGKVAAGIRLKQPDLELRARQELALAQAENTILLHDEFLTNEARAFLAHLLMSADRPSPEAVAHTTRLNEEARTLRSAHTPADLVQTPVFSSPTSNEPEDEDDNNPELDIYDPEMEFEEEEDYDEADYDL